jgi:hypothetical protein
MLPLQTHAAKNSFKVFTQSLKAALRHGLALARKDAPYLPGIKMQPGGGAELRSS